MFINWFSQDLASDNNVLLSRIIYIYPFNVKIDHGRKVKAYSKEEKVKTAHWSSNGGKWWRHSPFASWVFTATMQCKYTINISMKSVHKDDITVTRKIWNFFTGWTLLFEDWLHIFFGKHSPVSFVKQFY